MNKSKNKNILFIIIWASFTLAIVVFSQILSMYDSITYDSSYQYFLNLHSYKEIFGLIPQDYSPPLYALILKTYSVVFGNGLLSLRIFSVCLLSLLFLFILFPFRRLTDDTASLCAAFLALFSTYNLFFTVEIRPTVLAYVMTAGMFIYAALIFFPDEKRSRKSDIYIFSLVSLACMYTHNVSLIIAFCLYGTSVIAAVILKKKDVLKKFLISGVSVAVLFTPWLIVLTSQLGNVQDYFWEDTQSIFFGAYIALFGFTENYYVSILCLITIMFMIFMPLLNIVLLTNKEKIRNAAHVTNIVSKKDMKEGWNRPWLIIYYLVILAVGLVFFYLFTLFVAPIFAIRYLYIFSGVGILVAASLAALCKGKKILALILSALMCATFFCNLIGTKNVLDACRREAMVYDVNAMTDNEPVFIHFDEQSLGLMCYTFPQGRHFVCDQTSTVLQGFDVFECVDLNYIGATDEIWDYTDEVYIFNAVNFNAYTDTNPVDYYLYYFADPDNIIIEDVGHYRLPYCNEIGYNYEDNIILRVTRRS